MSTKSRRKTPEVPALVDHQKEASHLKGIAPPDHTLTAEPVQAKDDKDKKVHEVPEKTGTTQEGPLAIKGEGDSGAYDINDINQGSIGDCFFLAGLGAVLHSDPELIKKAIKDNGDGTFDVTLYTRRSDDIGEHNPAKSTNSWFTRLTKRTVTVTPDYPTSVMGLDTANPNASMLSGPHALGGDTNEKGQTEQWVRLIEKAYAVIAGGYDKIGNGGFSEVAMEALTGEQFHEKAFNSGKKKKDTIIESIEEGHPMVVSTKTQDKIDKADSKMLTFANANDIVGGHAYMVLEATDAGLKLRNPWGMNAANAEPFLTWDQFDALFNQMSIKK